MECIRSNYRIKSFVESRIGGRNENQDSYGFADTSRGFLAVVCDGMGGTNGGKAASMIAVEVILDYVQKSDDQASLMVILSKAISEANKVIINYAQNNPELRGMGTTVTALLINDDAAYVAHVGDSRIYQLRNSKKIFRTFDHSMVFELVKKKVLTEEQARLSSQSNIITRALGTAKDVIVDTQELSYRRNDRFVLCTDGFHSAMNEKDFINVIGKSGDANIILDNASEKIDNIGKSKGGGHDNLTAFIVEPQKDSAKEHKKRKIKYAISALLISILVVLSIVFNPKAENNMENDGDIQMANECNKETHSRHETNDSFTENDGLKQVNQNQSKK